MRDKLHPNCAYFTTVCQCWSEVVRNKVLPSFEFLKGECKVKYFLQELEHQNEIFFRLVTLLWPALLSLRYKRRNIFHHAIFHPCPNIVIDDNIYSTKFAKLFSVISGFYNVVMILPLFTVQWTCVFS